MMIGERNYSSNPTVHVPPWNVFDDPTADKLFPFAAGGTSVSPNGSAEDFSPFDAPMALHRYLPLNEVDLDSDESGRESDLPLDAYSCDYFRMFEFKVRKCTRGRSHDWTECPFAHPGEQACRRDPRKYHYSGTACPEFRKGNCKKGYSCEFAHGVFECWLHPARYRTQPCKDGPNCRRRLCFFAHTPDQLRVLGLRTPGWAESYDGSSCRLALEDSCAKRGEEEDALSMANCLMLLSRVGETSESACGSRNFQCKTCGREFATFQALGGHRASHKKPRLLSQNSDQLLSTSAGLLMGHGDRWCGLCDNHMELTANRNTYFCRRCHRYWTLYSGQRLNSSSAKSLNNQEYCSIDINDGEPNAKVLLPYKGSKVRDSCWATSPEMVLGVTSQAAISLMSFASTGSHSSPLLYVVVGFTGVGFGSALASRSLRRRNPRAASWFGKVGAVASASGFISALGMFLPQNTIWTSVVAGVSCLIPTIAMALA